MEGYLPIGSVVLKRNKQQQVTWRTAHIIRRNNKNASGINFYVTPSPDNKSTGYNYNLESPHQGGTNQCPQCIL